MLLRYDKQEFIYVYIAVYNENNSEASQEYFKVKKQTLFDIFSPKKI